MSHTARPMYTGFVVRKMPPRHKIISDIRERECKDQIRSVKQGGKDVV